jgi:hypothetical protein
MSRRWSGAAVGSMVASFCAASVLSCDSGSASVGTERPPVAPEGVSQARVDRDWLNRNARKTLGRAFACSETVPRGSGTPRRLLLYITDQDLAAEARTLLRKGRSKVPREVRITDERLGQETMRDVLREIRSSASSLPPESRSSGFGLVRSLQPCPRVLLRIPPRGSATPGP